jgi:DUF1680 family protein
MTTHRLDISRLAAPVDPGAGRLRPLGLREIALTGGFWGERQEINARVTLDHCEEWERRMGWIGNFADTASGARPTSRTGKDFSDSDVYKLLEAMAWEVGRSGDARINDRIEELARVIASAQQPDGYLNTHFGGPGQRPRYSDLQWGHELYSYGHLIQAGVARMRTGHHDTLTTVALRAADHLCQAFGPGGIENVCGHPEIETALVELYRTTGEQTYLDQARLFVDRRGHGRLGEIEFGPAYFQDDMPVRQATVLRGHAVRALYLAAGAVDLAVEDDDSELLAIVARQYAATLARRTYLTGGMGSRHQDESIGEDFELPPDRAYCETCAAVASVMVAWRLLLATGEGRWADVIERTLFNAIAVSPSQEGTAFFYANPLHQRVPGRMVEPDHLSTRAASQLRAPWFEVSCCPNNIARLFATLPTDFATTSDDGVQLHQYAPCQIRTTLGDGRTVGLDVRTGYPFTGEVEVEVVDAPEGAWELALRIPPWAHGSATVDGREADGPVTRITSGLRPGSVVHLSLPVAARMIEPNPAVEERKSVV